LLLRPRATTSKHPILNWDIFPNIVFGNLIPFFDPVQFLIMKIL